MKQAAILAILFLGAGLVSACGVTYYNQPLDLETEGDVVRYCGTTDDEARRWMNVCRSLRQTTHRMDTGELCYFTGNINATQRVALDEWSGSRTVVRTNCGTDRGDFMCEVTGDDCPIEGVYQQLPSSAR